MSRKQLSLLVNERAGFSPDMAVRIGMATNNLCQAKRRTKGVKVGNWLRRDFGSRSGAEE